MRAQEFRSDKNCNNPSNIKLIPEEWDTHFFHSFEGDHSNKQTNKSLKTTVIQRG